MNKYLFFFILSFMLAQFSCQDPDAPRPEVFTLMSITMRNIICDFEAYDKEGELSDTYTAKRHFRTEPYTREMVNFENMGDGAYLMEYEEDLSYGIRNGYLGVELSGPDDKRVAYFEFSQLTRDDSGSKIYWEIYGESLPESGSINPNGLLHDAEGNSTCVYFTHFLYETHRDDGTLSSKIVGYDCDEESFIDLFLHE